MSLPNLNSVEPGGNGRTPSAENPPAEPVTAGNNEDSGRVETGTGDFNVEDYKCPVCLDTFIDPVQSNCQHRFCDYCLRQWFRTRGNKYCPVCRTNIMSVDILQDMNAELERQLLRNMSRTQLAERERTRRHRLYELSRRPNPVQRSISPYNSLLQEEMFPISNELDDPWTWQSAESRSLDEAEVFQSSSNPTVSDSTSTRPPRRRHQVGHDSHRHIHHWLAMGNVDQYSYAAEYVRHLRPHEDNFLPEMSLSTDVNDQIRATTQRLSILNTFLAETVGQSLEEETDDEARLQGEEGSDIWDDGQTSQQSGEEQSNSNENTSRNNRNRFTGRRANRRRRNTVNRGQQWEPPSPPDTSYEEDTNPSAPTPAQQVLIDQFNARFQDTENAIAVVENAQAQLNQSSEHLRRIFDQCMSVGLDPDRSFGVFSRTPQRSPSLDNMAFSFEDVVRGRLHSSSLPRTPRSRLIPTEHHYEIWSTYLTPGFDSLPEEPGHSHPSFQGGMWYQRFLHNYPTGYPAHHAMVTHSSPIYAMEPPSTPHLYNYHSYSNISQHGHPPATPVSHLESAPRYFGHHGAQPQPVRHPNPGSVQNLNSRGNEHPRNQARVGRRGIGTDWANTDWDMPITRRRRSNQRSSGSRLNQAVQEAIRSTNTLTGLISISESGNASESQEESSNEQLGSNINIIHIDHVLSQEEEESEPEREVSVEYQIQLFN